MTSGSNRQQIEMTDTPPHDARSRSRAAADFRRAFKWIVIAAVIMVAAALGYLGAQGSLSLHVVIATILGVFLSVLLGSGLFALSFYSDKSGHDRDVTDATRRKPD